MSFQPKNKHGNRKGRPSVGQALATAVRASVDPEDWVKRVLELFASADDERVRLGCLQLLADRGWGKAKETIEVNGELSEEDYREELTYIAREFLESLSPEDRVKLLTNTEPSDTVQ